MYGSDERNKDNCSKLAPALTFEMDRYQWQDDSNAGKIISAETTTARKAKTIEDFKVAFACGLMCLFCSYKFDTAREKFLPPRIELNNDQQEVIKTWLNKDLRRNVIDWFVTPFKNAMEKLGEANEAFKLVAKRIMEGKKTNKKQLAMTGGAAITNTAAVGVAVAIGAGALTFATGGLFVLALGTAAALSTIGAFILRRFGFRKSSSGIKRAMKLAEAVAEARKAINEKIVSLEKSLDTESDQPQSSSKNL